MKGERLFRVLGLVDEDLIEEASPDASSPAAVQRRAVSRRSLMTVAACLVLVCGLGLFWRSLHVGGSHPNDAGTGDSGSGISHDSEPLHVDGTVFMSYAGPVFPLTAEGGMEEVTTERTITWDFAPGTAYDGSPRQWGAVVTDDYVLTNTSAEEDTVSLLYPFAGDLLELDSMLPKVTVNGVPVSVELIAGAYSGGFRDAGLNDGSTWNLKTFTSWRDYQALLEGGSYLSAAFEETPSVGIPVTVYSFTEEMGPTDVYRAATLAVTFRMDRSKTTVLSYGFNGYGWDDAAGEALYDFFIRGGGSPPETRYLILLGDDIDEYHIQGYQDGGCDPGEEIDGVHCKVTRTMTTLDDILRQLSGDSLAHHKEYSDVDRQASLNMITEEVYYRLVLDQLIRYGILNDKPMDRYSDGRLDDLFSETLGIDRILYLRFPMTIPAGDSVTVTAQQWKAPSFDYGCSGSENVGLQGYDMVTQLGSSLSFTGQTAALTNTDTILLIDQNFGFDLESGITEVTLDPKQDHYFMEIRPKE